MVLKENRHEDGSRNQNGRLYKDRSQEADIGSGAAAAAVTAGGWSRTMQLIKPFLLALFVLLTSKRAWGQQMELEQEQAWAAEFSSRVERSTTRTMGMASRCQGSSRLL